MGEPARQIRPDSGWPMYFASKPVKGDRISIEKGQFFPIQDKAVIRGLGAAAGCDDAWKRPFSKLPYVAVLDVGTVEMAESIRAHKLDYEQAKARVGA